MFLDEALQAYSIELRMSGAYPSEGPKWYILLPLFNHVIRSRNLLGPCRTNHIVIAFLSRTAMVEQPTYTAPIILHQTQGDFGLSRLFLMQSLNEPCSLRTS